MAQHPTAVAAGALKVGVLASYSDVKWLPLLVMVITMAGGRCWAGTADVFGAEQWTRESASRRSEAFTAAAAAAGSWWGVEGEGMIKATAGRGQGVEEEGMITATAARPRGHGALPTEVNAVLPDGMPSGEVAVTDLKCRPPRRRVFLGAVFPRDHRIGKINDDLSPADGGGWLEKTRRAQQFCVVSCPSRRLRYL